jgi:hypothetical protein
MPTFLDPLAAVLLLARARLGVMLAVAIITSDVMLSAWVRAKRGFQVGAFVAQGLFLIFVRATRLESLGHGVPRDYPEDVYFGISSGCQGTVGGTLSAKTMRYARL